ncbi:cytochrome P450 [Embleya scabrispora]|uniref:cytochrome P450 n=1 Tax=Embleya scabrispora TaxID=159449 RepID=UPI000D1C3C28
MDPHPRHVRRHGAGGIGIPAGPTILHSPRLIHRRRDGHDDPETFDPDHRASTPAPRPHPARDSFVAYGTGPRKCMGYGCARPPETPRPRDRPLRPGTRGPNSMTG